MLPFIFRWIELYAIIRAVVERSITPTVQASVSIVRGPSLYADRKSNIFPRSSQAISSPEEASPSAPGSILTTTEASPFSKRTKAPFGDLQRYCEAVVDESLRLFEEEADEAVEEFLPQLSQMLLGCTECLVSCFIVDSRRVAPKNQCASGYGEDTLDSGQSVPNLLLTGSDSDTTTSASAMGLASSEKGNLSQRDIMGSDGTMNDDWRRTNPEESASFDKATNFRSSSTSTFFRAVYDTGSSTHPYNDNPYRHDRSYDQQWQQRFDGDRQENLAVESYSSKLMRAALADHSNDIDCLTRHGYQYMHTRLEAAVLRRAARNPIVGTKLAWLLEDIAARLALNYFMSILVEE